MSSLAFIVLHPGLKLEYFRNQEWEQEWIDAAELLTRDEYSESYENEDQLDDTEPGSDQAEVRPFLDHDADANVAPYRTAMMPMPTPMMTLGTSS